MSDDTPTPAEFTADVAAVSDGARTLFIADFNDTAAAHEAYEALKSLEDGRHFAIDGVIVVNRDADGKLEIEKATDHSTKKGMKWGLVGGAALGLVFPPSIIGSAVALGAGGAALGKAHQLHDKIGLEKDLSDAVAPGPLGHRRPRLRPRCRADPRGPREGQRHRRARRQRGHGQGHPRDRRRGRGGLTASPLDTSDRLGPAQRGRAGHVRPRWTWVARVAAAELGWGMSGSGVTASTCRDRS